MKLKSGRSKLPFVSSQLQSLREENIIAIKDKADNIITKFKKLPDITLEFINPDSVKMVNLNPPHMIQTFKHSINTENKSRTNFVKKSSFSEINLYKKNIQERKRKLIVNNNYSPMNSIADKKMKKNVENVSNKFSTPEKKNKPRTNSSNHLSEIPQRFIKTESTNLQPRKGFFNSTPIFPKVEQILDKTNKSNTTIDSASRSIDFINESVPEYDDFILGINKESEYVSSTYLESSNYMDLLGSVKTSLKINTSNHLLSD